MCASVKCRWFCDGGLLESYHDAEWGLPCHDDRQLFEALILECLSSGLSWLLMLKKRDVFRACFADFDYARVAEFGASDVERIFRHAGMIKSRRKIEAVISNARAFNAIRREQGSFDKYIWHFTAGQTVIYPRRTDGEWQTTSPLSHTVAKDLKARGFKYIGPTLAYSFLQAIGVVNDHEPACAMFGRIGGTRMQ